MTKTTRARYTLEFKQEAVRLVEDGQSQVSVAKTLGLVEQTLFNGVKLSRQGQLKGADSKPVSAEQMEIARLRAELARVKMERDILGKATASPPKVADYRAMPGACSERQRLPRAYGAPGQRGATPAPE